ncbi:TerB family tellurite resistance protein [Robertkochia solimangrovi]|uniref:TerB family tellurite resistance protein n=1 Tax=Robertkochia solimangrovi TaxID=2213046 RepID=UPI00117F3298|nr:TerB family tellurite resistance protein [Robertkochia solimangrovi]TRZ42777.1 TerB family tellurite resistance protein [Robertkochia solimangrovi]
MNNKKEKLSLLSEMIALVRSDHDINQREYDFINAMAQHMEVGQEELEVLFTRKETPYTPPQAEAERILQFHRLVLLMNMDQQQRPNEMRTLKEFGLRMGLNPVAMDRVLMEMHSYPDKVLPPGVLINIFKTYYN